LNFYALLVQIIVGTIVLAPVLWLAGRALVGKEKAKFTDAVWIVVLGIILDALLGAYIGGLLGEIALFILWLALISHFFDCGWLKAFVIAIVAVIFFVIISAILALIGIGIVALAF